MQKELFKDFSGGRETQTDNVSVRETQESFFERIRIVLTLDKILLWVLANLAAIVFVYSFGIEHGVKLAKSASLGARLLEVGLPSESVGQQDSPEEIGEKPAAAEKGAAVSQTGFQANGEGSFTIQLVTYRREAQARAEVQRLVQRGHEAFIIPSGRYHQVCVELFGQKTEALQKLLDLKSDGYEKIYRDAYVRPVKR